MRQIFFIFFWFAACTLYGEIFELHHFKDIHPYLKEGTLVILDIDDTLLVPVQMLGCDEWFQLRLKYHQKLGKSDPESLERSLAEWEAVRHLTQMEIVEPGTAELIKNLQEQGYWVMGLTTQGLALATRTREQLLDQGIDLLRSSWRQDQYLMIDGHGVLYRDGILFTSGTHKGKSLFALFDKLGCSPSKIVFVNDKRSHLLSIEETAKEKGVEFVGLRFAYSDARKDAFDPRIADYQFSHSTFTHIISDVEAKLALK